jgi:hypothetical protein
MELLHRMTVEKERAKTMSIDFDNSRWDDLLKDYCLWWDDKLDRPLLNIRILCDDTKMKRPEGVIKDAFWQYGFEVPVEEIIHHFEYKLSLYKYIGDAYPSCLPDFGAGVNAAFQGANFVVGPDTVWFEPAQKVDITELKFVHNPNNVLYQRISDFYEKADAHFAGDVVLAMTHLNNGIDIPARFFDSVEFCTALYDDPEGVDRLVWENHKMCLFYIDRFTRMMKHNRGYTCWGDLLAPEPWGGIQSDFSVMISNEHFKRFVLPELIACARIYPKYNFYHIDGTEQLRFLDYLLDVPEIQAMQWVPGVDLRPEIEWMPLYKKIRNAGKKIWYFGNAQGLEMLADALGSLKGVYWRGDYKISEEETAYRIIERFT